MFPIQFLQNPNSISTFRQGTFLDLQEQLFEQSNGFAGACDRVSNRAWVSEELIVVSTLDGSQYILKYTCFM